MRSGLLIVQSCKGDFFFEFDIYTRAVNYNFINYNFIYNFINYNFIYNFINYNFIYNFILTRTGAFRRYNVRIYELRTYLILKTYRTVLLVRNT